jgi:hypothetical protein
LIFGTAAAEIDQMTASCPCPRYAHGAILPSTAEQAIFGEISP